MTSLAVMMTNLADDELTHTVYCMDCGTPLKVANKTPRARCPECRAEYYRTRARNEYVPVNDLQDPALNLCKAMILQARMDKNAGDRDAWQWLATDAELWLRCCGIGVTPSMRAKLARGRG